MGREEGGGFRMGNTCMPVADSLRYMAEPIQYCRVLKIKKKIKKKDTTWFYKDLIPRGVHWSSGVWQDKHIVRHLLATSQITKGDVINDWGPV